MRMSQKEKEKSHLKIVESAAKLFRKHGLSSTNVIAVMNEAGLTHGGFYRHFESKEALERAAIQASFSQSIDRLDAVVAKASVKPLEKYRAFYLSKEHVEAPGLGCPVAALAQEVGRATPRLKTEFTGGVAKMIEALGKSLRGTDSEKFDKSARELASLVGAIVLARATEPEMSKAILKACR